MDFPADITLSTLPVDIIRTIIQMEVPESIDNMRLISPSWNCLVTEFLKDKKRLPVIDHLLCHFEGNKYNSKLDRFEIFRSQNYERHVTYQGCSNQQINELKRNPTSLNLQIKRAISRCSKISVLTLNLIGASDTTLEYINTYLGSVRIQLLKVNVGANDSKVYYRTRILHKPAPIEIIFRSTVFNIVRQNKVQEVDLDQVNGGVFHDLTSEFDNGLRSIIFRYKPFYYEEARRIWVHYVQELNNRASVHAQLFEVEDSETGLKNRLRIKVQAKPANH